MFETITTTATIEQIIAKEQAVLIYFSTDRCNVCKVLKPKVAELLEEHFPKIRKTYINLDHLPEAAAQNRVFTVPTVLVFFEGHEYLRKSRNFGLNELFQELERPYNILFG